MTANQSAPQYLPFPGHLWFVLNILLYALALAAGASLWRGRGGVGWLDRVGAPRVVAGSLAALLAAVTLALPPGDYGFWAAELHTWPFGLVCFLAGAWIAVVGDRFFDWVARRLWVLAALGAVLYVGRLSHEISLSEGAGGLYPSTVFHITAPVESAAWMLAALGLATRLVRTPSAGLAAASAAVFPVYIVHYPTQNLAAWALQPLDLPGGAALLALLLAQAVLCLALYALVRRAGPLRLAFGLRPSP